MSSDAIVKIPFTRHQMNEKWYACKFKSPAFMQRLQSYGRTALEAEYRMFEILDLVHGPTSYSVEAVKDQTEEILP